MSVYNRFFLQQDGQLNPRILISAGPVLRVEISVPNSLADLLTRQKRSIPPPKTGFALIDTGATKSGVDKSAISELGVQPVGITSILTAGGRVEQSLFPAHFRFPGEGMDIEFSSVLGVDLREHQVNNQPIIALIGRDVLARLVFIYNGPGGFFTVAF